MGDWNSYEARPSLEGGSVEGPSLEEDCGSSGGECLAIFPILQALFDYVIDSRTNSGKVIMDI